MNEDLNPRRPSAEERVASFVRTAGILASAARASARVRPAAAIGARASALARALRALEVPARAAPARSSRRVADAIQPQASARPSPPRSAGTIAAIIAAASARPAPIASERAARAPLADDNGARIPAERMASSSESAEQRPSTPRTSITRALAAAQSAGVALSRVRQFTMLANLQSAIQDIGRAAGESAIPETTIPPAPPDAHDLNVAAMLTATGAVRRTIAQLNIAAAPEAAQRDPGDRGARRAPNAVTAIAMLPARVQRVLASARAASPSTDELALRVDLADRSRERGREFAAYGSRRSGGAAAPITINSSPSITVNLPPGAVPSGERGISRAVAQALEEHAEKLYEMMRQVGAFRARTEF